MRCCMRTVMEAMSMAFTQANLVEIEAAILSLARGTRKVSLTMGDKSITYGQTDIAVLESLRAQILGEISSETTRPRFVLTTTSKGL